MIIQKSGFLKEKCEKAKIGKIIFAKVLEMPLTKYLAYIERTEGMEVRPSSTNEPVKKKLFYAKIMIKDRTLCFEVSDRRLEKIYSTQNCTGNKIICSLKWINTRNKFSLHIFKSLLHYQRKYWFSGKEKDLKPLTLKQFLFLYPLQYLDQTRLSRLISSLKVLNPQGRPTDLKNLFISKKKYHSYFIKKIVNDNENALRDKDIQYLLASRGTHLSIRTICNCRKLFSIPNYKEKDAYYYGREITFSDYIMLSKKIPIRFQLNPAFMN